MGYEVEVKFRSADHSALRRRLDELGGRPGPRIDQEDTYLAHPSRDFAATNEALRVRREGGDNRITYKGPKHGGPTKTREEIELTFAEGAEAHAQMTRLLENLGFRPVARIRKTRFQFAMGFRGLEVTVALDSAEGLGDFAEVETLAATAAELPEAQGAVLELARELGLTEVEPRSYLRMVLETGGSLTPSGPEIG